jgi:hypothetical protein
MSKLPKYYPLYDTVYGSDFPLEQVFISLFDVIPSKYSNYSKVYDISLKNYLIENGFLVEMRNQTFGKSNRSVMSYIFINRKIGIILKMINETNKADEYYQLEILYDFKNGEIDQQLFFDKLKEFERIKKKKNISLIKSEMGHLDLEEYDLPTTEINLELNYGSKFAKIHDVIVQRLNKEMDKGIILLHGDPGTGKTSYLKFLTKLINEKEILFIPPSMAEVLSEPSIIPFLMEHKNSILIIEDAERVISDREGNGSPAGVSNILNLTDGILGDCLGIQIIATFNMKREKIDPALLRKGRLIAEHKFGSLNLEETNMLLKKLGKNVEVNEGMVLADIYNIDVETFKTQKENKIGFNRN